MWPESSFGFLSVEVLEVDLTITLPVYLIIKIWFCSGQRCFLLMLSRLLRMLA